MIFLKVEIDSENLEWYMKPFLVAISLHGHLNSEDLLKRYAELAGNEEPQELEDKKLLR